MNFLIFISDYIIPLIFFYVIGYALLQGSDLFADFIEGAKEGFSVVVGILPTLIGLMCAVGILRSSGALDLLGTVLSPLAKLVHFPSELVPLITVKMFSSSAATGLLLDIYKNYGPDSYLGLLASVIMSSSETIFYTVSVYFGCVNIKKTRYTIPGALFATLGSIIGSILIVNILCK